MGVLPYTTATGNVEKALLGIKAAATPEKVTQDFVKTILKIPGGSGDQMTALLKKLGFVNPDGTPSDIYKKFRNNGSTGTAAADALRTGYAALFKRNEFWPVLEDSELRGLIIEETGQDADSNVVTMTLNTIKGVKKFANFDRTNEVTPIPSGEKQAPLTPNFALPSPPSVGLNLGYTINLNLPATSDIAVFNAIFKSLKENLLKSSDENG
ncbi:DUF5343 domain-containing protein [Bradyrhizobium sp. CB1015]|uniref:DUF5343 domain-containing protein n=1 Tax=Bradyrhizobium sp. CB1015 TaxID=2976822 RepID=UPI0021A9C755|nr:DUF5343 domain-containing protein [Bradyrhizobium sp. CB1015]UWU89108.1 DUF5343 domain-containing protein [Bradyrhizobium sp. CB1015]